MLTGVINTNVNALYALNSLSNTANTANSLEQQLSSGLAINSPADNPAGYIAAQGFTAQISGVTQAISNANQAISLVQTANGAITQQVNILQSIESIANQAANGTATAAQLASLQQVVSQPDHPGVDDRQPDQLQRPQPARRHVPVAQFQVGAQAGQTIGVSIASTASNQIGAFQSSARGRGSLSHRRCRHRRRRRQYRLLIRDHRERRRCIHRRQLRRVRIERQCLVTVSANETAMGVAQSINAVTNKTNVTASADDQRGVHGHGRFDLLQAG